MNSQEALLKIKKYLNKEFLLKKIEAFWEKLKRWDAETPQRDKILILILICGLPLFIYFKFIFSLQQHKVIQLENDLKSLQIKLSKYKELAKREQYLEKIIKNRKKFLQRVKVILPSEKEIPELLKMIVEKAKSSGLEIISFTPQKEKTKNYYQIIPFTIKIKGDFEDLLDFLNEVECGERLVTLKSINIGIRENNKLETMVTFYTFKYTGKKLFQKKKRRRRR